MYSVLHLYNWKDVRQKIGSYLLTLNVHTHTACTGTTTYIYHTDKCGYTRKMWSKIISWDLGEKKLLYIILATLYILPFWKILGGGKIMPISFPIHEILNQINWQVGGLISMGNFQFDHLNVCSSYYLPIKSLEEILVAQIILLRN